MLLALDLGTRTGWAALLDGVTLSGTLRLDKVEPEQTRYRALWDFLVANVRPGDVVAFEDVHRHLGTQAAHVYGGLKAIVQTASCDIGFELMPVSVQAIKKHATGRGNADKTDMIAAARARGFSPLDDNEADALALLSFMQTQVLQ